ncbi:MAG TPA: nucleoside-diphosphate kinase [Candidatus Tetragenococcus pullicola]|nr:nucleoside-diphosphate kinase [Candidatus Tetragenococcus pullicola]
MEKTLVIIKPDGVKRQLIGRILQRFEDKNLKIVQMKLTTLSEALLNEHYEHLKEKTFFEELIEYMMSGPVVVIVLEGENVIKKVRQLVGVTDPQEAEMGTLRGDFGLNKTQNLVHASDSLEAAKREVSEFFQ